MTSNFPRTRAKARRADFIASAHSGSGRNRFSIRHVVFGLLLALAAGCGHDSTSPGYEPPPPPPPPPSLQDGLWTSSGLQASIFRLAPDQLLSSGTLTPATIIATPSADLFQFNAIAFDADGTMWITSHDDAQVLAFAPSTLESTGFRTATVRIGSVGRSLSGPTAIAFDRQHRLWIANSEDGTLVRFDRAQLGSSGTPTPAVVLSGVGHPRGMAFDAAGSLWVSDVEIQRIVKYGAAQLEASGAPVPEVVLTSVNNSLAFPSGIAFDAAGNLWVANVDLQTVVSFGVSQLAASGSPVPQVVLSPNESSAPLPVGLAFDGQGNLWVVSVDGVLVKYDRAALGQSGATLPSVHLVVENSVLFWSVAFWPRPAGLPLN